MDGFQAHLSDSIRLRLAFWLSLAIFGFALCVSVLAYFGALKEANELQDDTLRQVAALVSQQPGLAPALASRAPGADPESNLIVQRLSDAAQPAAGLALALPPGLVEGPQTVPVAGVPYRVLVRPLPDGSRVAVAQQTDVRDEIARDGALRVLLPLLLLLPLLVLLVAQLVRRMLGPIARLSREVDARSQHELHALPVQGVASEIQPFITAINRLLARAQLAMAAQRRFVADAAHELRSPLTALLLQAERLQGAEMSDEARGRLRVLRLGIERGRHLLDQLLGLARSYDGADEAPTPVALPKLCRRVLEELLPLAEAKRIDLGMTTEDETFLAAPEVDLAAVLRNLVDNAIRYTPDGGRVDVRIEQRDRQVLLQVEDDGPGIPAAERGRVLDPFYRILGTEQQGSGLGLSIVRAVVQRLEGRLEIDDSPTFGRGLRVTVTLPATNTAVKA